MKTYHERSESVTEKIKVLQKQRTKRRHIITTSCLLLIVVTLALVLFVPYNTAPPDVSEYKDSPYYGLIQKINAATYEKPKYKNNFHYLTSKLVWITGNKGVDGIYPEPEEVLRPGMTGGSASAEINGGNTYVEVTDNQVAGVTEADRFKRTDQHIFYLWETRLHAFEIDGLDSNFVCDYDLEANKKNVQYSGSAYGYPDSEMYLSADGTVVTIVSTVRRDADPETGEKSGTFVCVQNLKFNSEEESFEEIGCAFISGTIVSSRMVDGKLLVMSDYRISKRDVEFGDATTFVPQVGTEGKMENVVQENVITPEVLGSLRYTVVAVLDSKTLEATDSAAFLSYSQELYVSRDRIFATRGYTEQMESGDVLWRNMTEISCVAYNGGNLVYKGSVKLPGNVKNQYSMDEYEGILRVVTSTSQMSSVKDGNTDRAQQIRNASLYCVSLEDFSIVASVENFAPEGEQAESVRFDADTAYVCTAEVITLTDPVYFFDLSDLNNITWKDTGTIDGYSSSLVNFGNGFLIGIGYGGDRGLKIEVYEEAGDKVESVCAYELQVRFSEEYKSYYIDREKGLVGLAVNELNSDECMYVLLYFDGYELHKVVMERAYLQRQYLELIRGCVIDDCLYVLGDYLTVYALPR